MFCFVLYHLPDLLVFRVLVYLPVWSTFIHEEMGINHQSTRSSQHSPSVDVERLRRVALYWTYQGVSTQQPSMDWWYGPYWYELFANCPLFKLMKIRLAGSNEVLCNCIQDGTISYHRKRPDRHVVSATFYFSHITRSSPAAFEFPTGMSVSVFFLSVYWCHTFIIIVLVWR